MLSLLSQQEDQSPYQSLETLLEEAVGPSRSWAAAMDSGLVNNLGECWPSFPCPCARMLCVVLWGAGPRH
jgi:hypothetical protein